MSLGHIDSFMKLLWKNAVLALMPSLEYEILITSAELSEDGSFTCDPVNITDLPRFSNIKDNAEAV